MNIAIIENNDFYRESLKTALNQIVDFKVVFETDHLNSFFQRLESPDFQIILLDFCFYQDENIKRILQLSPATKILVLSNYDEKYFFENIDNTLIDFIPKSANKNLFKLKIRKLVTNNIITF
jgi:DNA-binding NarL/FixJ family response regulator